MDSYNTYVIGVNRCGFFHPIIFLGYEDSQNEFFKIGSSHFPNLSVEDAVIHAYRYLNDDFRSFYKRSDLVAIKI